MKSFIAILLLLITPRSFAQIKPIELTCEYKTNPIIDELGPRFAWKYQAGLQDMMQSAYQVQVAGSARDLVRERRLIWDSQKVFTEQAAHVEYGGPQLEARGVYSWRVRGWDQDGNEGNWSDPSYWEMGLLDSSDWQAEWIGPSWAESVEQPNPAPMLRHEFILKKNIVKARLYITARGLYSAYINGNRVGDQLFTPGWTSYHKRLQYQVFDVKELLSAGENCLGVMLGDGWYRGEFGFDGSMNVYGDEVALLCQLEVEYRSGRKDVIKSDKTWQGTTGPIRMSSLYDGEVYDARLEQLGWATAGFNDSGWQEVKLSVGNRSNLMTSEGVPVKRITELRPIDIFNTPNGEVVVDMGQNMVGWMQIKVAGTAGDTITLRHAEVLDKDGNFYIDNLRAAAQQVQYICKGSGVETYEPHFTFQGFRYVSVEGYPGELTKNALKGIVIHSDMEMTGQFTCSNQMLNQLQSNIQWGQRGNFLDVPTDCPQRDERMGWTGDAQAFAPTACFNFNTAAFYTRWLQDLAADQRSDGAVPFVVPNVLGEGAAGSTGWADAATIVPWTLYLKFGDKRILERQYQSMKAWILYLEQLSGDNLLVQDGFHFGDWLFFIHPTDWNAKPGHTDIDFIATAFFYHSSEIMMKTAVLLGESDDVEYFADLLSRIKTSFQSEFVTPNGRLSPHSQTAYALALRFGLLEESQKTLAAEYLKKDIESRQYHLSTGFLGTPHLPHVLSENGMTDVAYRLLLQESYPSWLYPLTQGATTIWERWDGIKPDGSFQTPQMNSFNHYAYGAIGDWMYSVMAGLRHDESNPGYKHIIYQPHPTSLLDSVQVIYESLNGQIMAGWKISEDSIEYRLNVPPNTMATVILPASDSDQDKVVVMEVRSGQHRYTYPFAGQASTSRFTIDSLFGELWSSEEAKAILLRHIPTLALAPQEQLQQGFAFSLRTVAQYAPDVFTDEILEKIQQDLKKL
jgi:alpha-L-rhamnosidase